jgi:hypothetical protein
VAIGVILPVAQSADEASLTKRHSDTRRAPVQEAQT